MNLHTKFKKPSTHPRKSEKKIYRRKLKKPSKNPEEPAKNPKKRPKNDCKILLIFHFNPNFI
jgi:hypothetical protein